MRFLRLFSAALTFCVWRGEASGGRISRVDDANDALFADVANETLFPSSARSLMSLLRKLRSTYGDHGVAGLIAAMLHTLGARAAHA